MRYPFIEDGLVLADIKRILEESGLGLPTFSRWGRTRSGCFFCFYQQKIEWVRLKETHPDLFEQAKAYEYANMVTGNPFYWNGDEPLEELEKPVRVEEIKRKWQEKKACIKKETGRKSLMQIFGQYESDEDEERTGCLICQI